MGYRGGGSLPGEPSETALKTDALAVADALDRLVPGHGPVVVQGYSLGTGLAVHVAAERAVDGLILAAPYARICELMAAQSGLPACLIPGIDRWRSLRDAPRVTEPALVLHGRLDHLIPFDHGERMARALPRGRLVPVEQGGHDDLMDHAPYLVKIDTFLDGL
nr:alpha/beta hydrolase [Sagittula salina]